MKNLFKLLFLFCIALGNAQTQTITPQLKLATVVEGSANDSVLVRGADKIVKYVKKSDLLAGANPTLQSAVNNGNTVVSGSNTLTLQADQVRSANSAGNYADLKADGSVRIGRYTSGSQKSAVIIPNPAGAAYSTQTFTLPAVTGTLVTAESLPTANINSTLAAGNVATDKTLTFDLSNGDTSTNYLTSSNVRLLNSNNQTLMAAGSLALYRLGNQKVTLAAGTSGELRMEGGASGSEVTYKADKLSIFNGSGGVYDVTFPNSAGRLALQSEIPSTANFVQKTGNETIAGNKTFSNDISANALNVPSITMEGYAFIETPSGYIEDDGGAMTIYNAGSLNLAVNGDTSSTLNLTGTQADLNIPMALRNLDTGYGDNKKMIIVNNIAGSERASITANGGFVGGDFQGNSFKGGYFGTADGGLHLTTEYDTDYWWKSNKRIDSYGGFSSTWANGYLNLGTNYGSANVRTFDYFSTGDDTDFPSSTEVLIRANVEEMIHLKASNTDGSVDLGISPYEVTINGDKVLTHLAVSYSTVENKTEGRWINGKPIYRIVIEIADIGGDGFVQLSTSSLNIQDVVLGSGKIKDLDSTTYDSKFTQLQSGEAIFDSMGRTEGSPATYILEYTKTTD